MTKHNPIQGLGAAEVERSRRENGSNVLTPPKRTPGWKLFLAKFSDSLIIILLVAGVLSIGIAFYEYFGLGEPWQVFFEPIGIFLAILLATGLAFLFEQKANRAFRILNRVNDDEAVQVIRDGHAQSVPRRDVVVGDVVILDTGDEIPADGELLDAVTLAVDESTLTGEPVTNKTTDPAHFDPQATFPSNRVYRGTKVMTGHGIMRVLAVGDSTEMGAVYKEAQIDDSVKTPLNEQLNRLAKWITFASYVIAGLVIAVQLIVHLGASHFLSWLTALPVLVFFWLVIRRFPRWSKKTCGAVIAVFFAVFIATVVGVFSALNPGAGSEAWSVLLAGTLQTLMVAVTLIVVAVPEGLPMAVTLSLAYSMSRMLKTNNLVRKMHACETMGATTVICTDKTGTLTQNRMQVSDVEFFAPDAKALLPEAIAANSTARLNGDEPLGNPTEGALLLWLRNDLGADYRKLRNDVDRIDEVPFTTERKYMSTTVVSALDGRRHTYIKGAPEIVCAMCPGLDASTRARVDALLAGYQAQAKRTLAIAATPADSDVPELLAIVAISDPVRPDVPEAVREVLDAGIKVKIVTGDTPGTAKEIGRQIGLWNDATCTDRNIVTGPEVAEMSDEELRNRVEDFIIIARARPLDKKRLVEALQARGEVVAVTGDGTNDAPALKTAHVGLSMGDGTSVAKEASDITIIDNSFASIGRAVMWGRSLYQNIQRFLLFQLTVNVAACLLVLVGSFWGYETPLSVTQMLWVNLIMDTFGAMALASLPPSRSVMHEKPRNRRASILTRPMAREILGVGFLFFAITIACYWVFTHSDVHSLPEIFRAHIGEESPMTVYDATLLFSIFVWTHFWYMFNARCFETEKSVFRVPMSSGFWTIVGVIVAGQLFITEIAYNFFNVSPMLHVAGSWEFNPSGALDFAIIVLGSTLVVFVREIYLLIAKK